MKNDEAGVPLSEDSARQWVELDGIWQLAPSAANGAALLALLNLVGSVDDPDFAFAALRWVFLLVGAGLIAGLAGLLSARRQKFHERYLKTTMTGLLTWGDEVKAIGLDVGQMHGERDVERLRTRLKESEERITKLRGRMNRHFNGARREAKLAELLRQFSVLALCGAFLLGWFAHLSGRHLQPAATQCPAVQEAPRKPNLPMTPSSGLPLEAWGRLMTRAEAWADRGRWRGGRAEPGACLFGGAMREA